MTRLDRRSLARTEVLDQSAVRYLITGIDHFADIEAWPADVTAQAWDLIEEHVMPTWVEGVPGSRPWGWWTFRAPEPRRQTGGPSCADREPCWFGTPSPRHWDSTFESEAEYLERLSLWFPQERRRFRAAESQTEDTRRREAVETILQMFPEDSQ